MFATVLDFTLAMLTNAVSKWGDNTAATRTTGFTGTTATGRDITAGTLAAPDAVSITAGAFATTPTTAGAMIGKDAFDSTDAGGADGLLIGLRVTAILCDGKKGGIDTRNDDMPLRASANTRCHVDVPMLDL